MLLLLKYTFSIALTLVTLLTTHNIRFVLFGLLELCVIFLITNLLVHKHKIVGNICNIILLLLYHIQMLVLFFGNSFVIPIMLTNLNSLEDLAGKALIYVLGVVALLIFTLLPISPVKIPRFHYLAAILCIVTETVFAFLFGGAYSPALSYISLITGLHQAYIQQTTVASSSSASVSMYREELYRTDISDYRCKESTFSEHPNIVLIFTEGISNELLYDERSLMPNLRTLSDSSLHFDGYWNHTMATYRALIGSLYSGYQLQNSDPNDLISLQDILKSQGYHTTLINTEPANADFTSYLASFGYDELIGPSIEEINGYAGTASDNQSFSYLLETIKERSTCKEPYFITIYTIGTHASFDSNNEKFADGSNHLLNRVYNLDDCLGDFLKEMEKNHLFQDTLLVVTADHATYHDNDYTEAMHIRSENNEFYAMLDTIPLLFYYPDITPEAIDVNGRNSLDLAPTILDYLDISMPNYFLGQSLFAPVEDTSDIEYIFQSENDVIRTADSQMIPLSSDEKEASMELINRYFIAKKPVSTDSDFLQFSKNNQKITITYHPDHAVSSVWIPVWSETDGQDDLQWYEAKAKKDGSFTCVIKVTNHLSKQNFNDGELLLLQIYEGASSPETCIKDYSIWFWGKEHILQ